EMAAVQNLHGGQVQIVVEDITQDDAIGRAGTEILELNKIGQGLVPGNVAGRPATPWRHCLVIGITRAIGLIGVAGGVVVGSLIGSNGINGNLSIDEWSNKGEVARRAALRASEGECRLNFS